MGCMDLAIKVTNISPLTTKEDLIIFFSYCGTVKEIELQRERDQSQVARVTFGQPYAFQTALLLNGSIIRDQRVCISPLEMIDIPISSSEQEEMIAKAKDLLTDTTRILTRRASMLAEEFGSGVVNNENFAKGAIWVSQVLDMASKSLSQLAKSRPANDHR